MDKQKQAMRNQREDAVLNRVLIWFGAAVVAEFLLLLLNRYFVNYTVNEIMVAAALEKTLFVLQFAGLAAAVGCAVWWNTQRKQDSKGTLQGVLAMVCLALFICCAGAYWFRAAGVQLLCALVPAVAVMALIYYLYQKEFFTVTAVTALGILGMWMIRKANGAMSPVLYIYAVVVAVVLLAVVLLALRMQKEEGVLTLGAIQLHVFPSTANYPVLYTTCGLVAAALIAGLALGVMLAYYLIFVLVAWLFVMAVYYTVKLM